MPSVQEYLAIIAGRDSTIIRKDEKILELRETISNLLQEVDNKEIELSELTQLVDDLSNNLLEKDDTVKRLRNIIGESSLAIRDLYLEFAVMVGNKIVNLYGYRVVDTDIMIMIDGSIVIECSKNAKEQFSLNLSFKNYSEQLDYLLKLVKEKCRNE